MQAIRKLLVVVDTRKPEHTALNRACAIAHVTGSQLHILCCNPHPDEETHAVLSDWCEPIRAQGLSVTKHIHWYHSLHETIIKVQQAEQCELVIKDAREESELSKVVFTPSDWKLLRQCPAAILLVKNDKPWENGNILAAVDADPNDGDHQILNDVIISHARDIAGLADGECHLASAHPAPMLSSPDPVYQLQDALQKKYLEVCTGYADKYHIPLDHIHVEEGPASTYIPHIAKQLDAPLVVIGTVARSGLKGAIIGNTAEQIIDGLEADILTLKPTHVMETLEAALSHK
ncbi:universal stress protein [Zooshikella marina]|uniref:universal stress protein n=1 Tax=Zooshikella ganghwensis TaxID=202772 RepID=UPI001BAF00E6|nr:universal stress protein [Zooshikella ganghwensis]MBU2706941.1 universal stress protein [Zooshikella ganghwensis]